MDPEKLEWVGFLMFCIASVQIGDLFQGAWSVIVPLFLMAGISFAYVR